MTTDSWRCEPKDYSLADLVYEGKRSIAMRRLKQAVSNGSIEKINTCQVCDSSRRTVAHHWMGYNYPFKVWWVCYRCNANLPAHDGSMTLEDARRYIANVYDNRMKPTIYKHHDECSVCGCYASNGKYIVFDNGVNSFVCQFCLSDLDGDMEEG